MVIVTVVWVTSLSSIGDNLTGVDISAILWQIKLLEKTEFENCR